MQMQLGKVPSVALHTRSPPSLAGLGYLLPTRQQSAGCRVSRLTAAVSSSNGSQGVSTQHFSLSTSFASASKLTTSAHADAAQSSANVSFWLKLQTSWGQGVKLIGSHPKLGSWSVEKAVELRWAEGNMWTATVSLPTGAVYEYKYVVIDFGTKMPVMWQHGGNAVLAVDMSETKLDVHDNWGNDPGAEVRSDGLAITRENKLQKWAGTLVSQYKSAVQDSQQLVQWAQEGQAVKGELARVKMELSLMQQAQRQSDLEVAALKKQNTCLQQDLIHARQELNASFTEALKLLTEDTWDMPEPLSEAAGIGCESNVSDGEDDEAMSSNEPSETSVESAAEQQAENPRYSKWMSMNDISSVNGRNYTGNGQGAPAAAARSWS